MSEPVFDEAAMHRDWLLRLREEYDSVRRSADEGRPAALSAASAFGAQPTAESQLPRAFLPTRRPSWATPQQQPDWETQWADAMGQLEVEDAPVYRSLGGDAPVYRGFAAAPSGNAFEGMDAMRSAAASDGPESVDPLWLSRMPPLLSRQNAFNGL